MTKILLLSGPDKKVGYEKEIKKILKLNLKGERNLVCISATPDNYEKNDKQVYGKDDSLGIIKMLKDCEIYISNACLIDNRNVKMIDKNILINSDIIYFMGGDPLLQNEFVINNDLLETIKKSDAFIIGVSAGSMNLAKNTFIPKYESNPKAKFIKGFDMCDISIIPHFDINDILQVEEAKENAKTNPLIGLPNNSAVFINEDKIEYINDFYLYD